MTRTLSEPTSEPGPARDPRDRKVALALAVGLVALAGGLYAAAYAAAGDGLPRGASVLGVHIGGKSRDAAARLLEARLADRTTAPIEVTVDDVDTYRIEPETAGLRLDVDATLDEAGGSSANPLTLLRRLFGDNRIEPRVSTDRSALEAAVARIADRVDQAPREGAVRFEAAAPVVVTPRDGQRLDREAFADAVQDAYLNTVQVDVDTAVAEPAIGQGAVDRALSDFARPAVSAPVVLAAGSRRYRVTPQVFAPTLSLRPEGDRLRPRIDAQRFATILGSRFASLARPPRDASYRLVHGEPQVVPGVRGRRVDVGALGAAMLHALSRDGEARVVPVPLRATKPEFTTARAKALGVRERVSSFTTYYPYAAYRLQNIHRAADLIDGSVVRPGAVWSLNQTVGERTAENGFAVGIVISGGRFREDFGGGTSQVATTTFNAAYFAGLDIVQHKPHSFYISRYPEGREATVAWPSVDLKFRNDSGKGILITTAYTSGSVTVSMWGTKRYDVRSATGPRYNFSAPGTIYDAAAGCVPQDPVSGFDVDVTRTLVRAGAVADRETFHTHYVPTDHVVCAPEPEPEPTKTPEPTRTPRPTPSPSPSS